MNNTKKINVSYSALIGLKAELQRKQDEIEDRKAKVDSTLKLSQVNVNSKKQIKNKDKGNENVKKKNIQSKKTSTDIEDSQMLQKSKYILEAKSKLYEKLKGTSDDSNQIYLVDFKNKCDDELKNIEQFDDDTEENYDNYEHPSFLDPGDDWVEYQDFFGRTRKCLRRDLPRMREKDNLIRKEIVKEQPLSSLSPPSSLLPNQDDGKPSSLSSAQSLVVEQESEIEIMRKKWEEETARLSQKSDIHYQDILFDEARAHGVGYYAFSQDENERLQQQTNLAKIRKETEQRQRELEEMKKLKSKIEQNRLKAAKIRQRIRAGLPPLSPTATEQPEVASNDEHAENVKNEAVIPPGEVNNDKSDETLTANQSKTQERDEKSVENKSKDQVNFAHVDKIKAFEEFVLLGKTKPKWRELSQAEWVQKRRKDRYEEFAPVYNTMRPILSNATTAPVNSVNNNFKQTINSTNNSKQAQSHSDEMSQNEISNTVIDIESRSMTSSIEINNTLNIPLPPDNDCNEDGTKKTEEKDINTDQIMAGLKYLRQQFDDSHNT